MKLNFFLFSFIIASQLNSQIPNINAGEGFDKSAKIFFSIDSKVRFVGSSPSSNSTYYIKNDSSLWAFGRNDNSQLGDNSNTTRSLPIRIGLDNDWIYVSSGLFNAGAIKSDGTLWTWGNNDYYQLGDGTSTSKAIPVQIGTENGWKSIVFTTYSVLALKKDGTLWSWGSNDHGRLGRGFKGGNYGDIKQIGNSNNWKSIACGDAFCLALNNKGQLYTWGFNGNGQLGDSTIIDSYSPKYVDSGYLSAYCAQNSVIGMKKDSSLWSWGQNLYGIYGSGAATSYYYPIKTVSTGSWNKLSAGGDHVMAIKKDGSLWSWGYNGSGCLGDSTNTNKYKPVNVKYLKKVSFCALGNTHSLIIDDSGSLYSFGSNIYGELGIGNYTDKNYPSIIVKGFSLKSFAIYRSIKPISDTATIGLVTNKVPYNNRSFVDTGLVNGKRYYYRIKSLDSLGNITKFSNQVLISVNKQPTSVDFVKVQSGPRRVYLSWLKSSTSNVKYTIYRGKSPNKLIKILDTTSLLDYLDSALSPGTVYFYGIRVIDSFGVLSTYSKIVKISVLGRCYVSTAGSMNLVGSNMNPINSIPFAISLCATGDTVIIKDGIYQDQIFMGNRGIVIASEYLIDGDTSHIYKTRLDGQNHFGNTYFINGPSNNLLKFQIVGLTIEKVNGRAVAISNIANSTVRNVFFEYLGDINGSVGTNVDVYGNAIFDGCVFRYNPQGTGSSLININSVNGVGIIDRCEFYKNKSRGQLISGNRVIIRNSYFYHNYAISIAVGCNGNMDSCFIINNAFVENYYYAIRLNNNVCGGGLTGFIINNIFENNGYNPMFRTNIAYSNVGYSVVNFYNNLMDGSYARQWNYPSKFNYKINLSKNDTINGSGIIYPIKSTSDIVLPNYSIGIGMGITTNLANFDYYNTNRPNPTGTPPDLGPKESPAFFPSPKLIEADGGDRKISLTWSQTSFKGLNKFKLYRSTSQISDTATMGMIVDTLSATSSNYKDIGLTNLKRYFYRIKSVNSSGQESGFSNELSNIPSVQPFAVDSIRVQSGARLNYISWTPSKTSRVKYRVYRGFTKTSLEEIKDTTSNVYYLDTNLTAWKTYYYAIRTIDSLGIQSEKSLIKSGTPDNIWWVDTAGNDKNIGSNLSPFSTIEYAVKKAISISRDTVIVKNGIYYCNIDMSGKGILIVSQNGPLKTILKPFYTLVPVIDFKNNETKKSEISGFTVKDARYCYGVNVYSSRGIVRNMIFTKCGENTDGIVTNYYGGVDYENCLFVNNPNIVINHTAIDTTNGFGSVFNHCVFYNNGDFAKINPNSSSGKTQFYNSIIWNNNNLGKNKMGSLKGDFWMQFCTVDDTFYSNIASNFNFEPAFKDTSNFDFSLSLSSPLIGRGSNNIKTLNKSNLINSTKDIDGRSRPLPLGSNPDIGAYENIAAFPVPELLSAEGGEKKITLTCSQSFIKGLTEYKLYRSIQPISDTALTGLILDTFVFKTLSYVDSGLTNLIRYYYRVKCVNSLGQESEFSNELSAIPNTPPDSPDSIRLVNGSHKVILSWPKSNSTNITYNLVRSETNMPDVNFINLRSLNYIDSTVQNRKSYTYKVCAVDSVGVKSIFTKPKKSNIYPYAFINNDTNFNNIGRNSREKHYFLQTSAYDLDGRIDSTIWYIDGIRVANDDTLKYKFRQGTTKVMAVVFDNDFATDTNVFFVNQLSFVKLFREGLVYGVSMFDDNNIFVSDTSLNSFNLGEILCLDSNGNTKINYLVNNRIRTTPSIDNLANIYLTNGLQLTSFSKTGAPLFNEIQLGGLSYVTPTIDSVFNRLYLGISNKKFFALNLSRKGEIAWDFTTDAPISSPAVISSGRKLIFTDVSGRLYGFDISTTLNPKTGAVPKWKFKINNDSFVASPSLDTFEKVIVGTSKGNLMKLELDSDGVVRTNWVKKLNKKITTSAVLDAFGHIFIGTIDGFLHCFRSSDGNELWKFKSGSAILSTPTISEKNRIYFANIKGHVYCLDTGMNIIWYYMGDDAIVGHLVHSNGATYIPTVNGKLKLIFDRDIESDIKTIQSQITSRKRQLNIPKPIWSSFQGNSRRTGMQDGIFKIIRDGIATENTVYIFPNPSFGQFQIESLFGIVGIDLIDLSGSLIKNINLPNATNCKIDVSGISPGFYFMRIITENGIVYKKIEINL